MHETVPDLPRWVLPAVAVGAVLFHLPALTAGFSQDDTAFYVQNQSIRSLGDIPASFLQAFPPGDPERGLYRPLTNTSYTLDFALFGTWAPGPHAVNLLLYGVVIVLFGALARRFLHTGWALVAAVALFGVHPVHTEVVDSVSGRSELLGLLFSLAALVHFHDVSVAGGRARGVVAWACFVLATLAKETAVVLPGALLLHGLVTGARSWRAALARVVPFFAWVPVYLLLRATALGQLTPSATVLGDADAATWFSTVGAVAAEYTRLLLAPTVLQVDGYYLLVHPGILARPTVSTAAGWVVVFGLLGAFLVHTRRAVAGSAPPSAAVGFGLGLAAAWMFPVSHVVPFGALLAERFLFAPSAGFVLAAAAWVEARVGERPGGVARMAFVVVVVAFGVRSTLRAREWESTATLWAPLLAAHPTSARLQNSVAGGYLEAGDLAAALPHLDAALRLDPDLASAVQNRGWIQLQRGDLVSAEADYRRAAALAPENPVILTGLGDVCGRTGRLAEAVGLYERALELDPYYATAAENLARTRPVLAEARAWLAAHPEPGTPEEEAIRVRACRAVGGEGCGGGG